MLVRNVSKFFRSEPSNKTIADLCAGILGDPACPKALTQAASVAIVIKVETTLPLRCTISPKLRILKIDFQTENITLQQITPHCR
jgi:hypothetical protein